MQCPSYFNFTSIIFFTDHFVTFGKYLMKEEVKLQSIWDEVLGRYERAVLHLVVDLLHSKENAVKRLVHALRETKPSQSAQQAAKVVRQG